MLSLKVIVSKLQMLDETNEKDRGLIDKYISEYKNTFNEIIDELTEGLDLGKEKYEPMLRLKYQYKMLKGVDPEFLIELRHGDYIHDLANMTARIDFYIKYKNQFQMLSERLETDIKNK